jgi:hypothetical protein
MTAAPPPPRPSTARLSAPPLVARRSMSRPRTVIVSCWLWLLAAFLAVATAALALTRIDDMRAELGRVARDSDPSATPDMVDRVVDLSVLVIVGGGLLLGVLGVLVALALRAGRRWSRVVLITLTLLACAYGVLVVDSTGWLVLGYSAVTVAAAVCMYLPGSRGWFG